MSKILVKRILSVSLLTITILFLPIKDNLTFAASSKVEGTVTSSVLNVRSNASPTSKVLGALKKGQNISILSSSNGWGKFTYKSKVGYVSLKYVKTKTVQVTTTSTKQMSVNATKLNVRQGTSPSSKILGTLKKGEKITVKGISGIWSIIDYKGKKGYVSTKYLSKVNTTPVKGVSNVPNTTTTSKMKVKTDKLNVRKFPDTKSSVVATLKQNTIVDVNKINNIWGKVTVGKSVGYVSLTWMESVEVTTPAEPTTISPTVKPTVVTKNIEVTSSTLNVRSAANNTSNVLGVVKKGDKLPSQGKSGDWYKVTYNKKMGYVHFRYVKEVTITSPKPSTPKITKGYITSTSLNVREKTNASSRTIGVLKKNEEINILSVTNNWATITYKKQNGYVLMTYVTSKKPSVPNVTTSKPSTGKYIVDTKQLTVRKKPDSNSDKLGYLSKGTEVKVLQTLTGWYKIEFKGSTGYVSSDFVKKADEKTATKPINNVVKNLTGKTIVVDAGHGGRDSGAIGNGLYEKDINLDTALYLKSELIARGAKVIMTRVTDTYPTLGERINLSNQSGGDMFISIHINSASSNKASGVETYYYNNPNKTLANKSSQLAQSVQKEMLKTSPMPNRGIQTNIFQVIKYNNLPSVLVELGFISNKYDVSFLKRDDFKKTEAKALANGIVNFLN